MSQYVKLTAPVEGAIAAVFAHIKDSVAVEIDMPEVENNWRELILAARRQHGAEELLNVKCQELTEWGFDSIISLQGLTWQRVLQINTNSHAIKIR